MPTRDHPVAACPGALQVHQAADGGLARIRLPGGRLAAGAFQVIAQAAAELGDGSIELTSRANLQIRGLAPGAESELAARLASVGLLPSATHERVRNILADPLAGPRVRELVHDLDRSLCARLGLAALPERFLFSVDLPWPDADIAALGSDPVTILLAGVDVGLHVPFLSAVPTMLACAEAFLELRTSEWRLAELDSGPERIARQLGADANPHPRDPGNGQRSPLGLIPQPDGMVAVSAAVPLGRLTPAQASALPPGPVVITPWRSLVIPDLQPGAADLVASELRTAGLLLDPSAPGVGITACTGRPGCAKALADVRTDATAMIATGTTTSLPIHWSACPRRCGRPRGEAIDIIATEDGYTITRTSR